MSDLITLASRLRAVRRNVDGRIAEAKLIAANGKSLKEEIKLAEDQADLYAKVAITLASIGEAKQADAQRTIEDLVTRGLQSIFKDPDLQFKVIQTQRGKTPEVKFIVESLMNNSRVSTSIMDARGGGLAAIVGFLLRLVVMLLSNKEPILILDEAFAHVSAEFEEPLAEFIAELIAKTRAQVVLVTHSAVFSQFADKKYKLKLSKGITQATEL